MGQQYTNAGRGVKAGGLETNGGGTSIIGGLVDHPYGQGLGVDPGTHPGLVVSGVTFIDVGQDGTGNDDCIVIPPNFTDFVITGNRCTDDQASGTMRFGLAIQSGDNNYTVTGNNFTSLLRPNGSITILLVD